MGRVNYQDGRLSKPSLSVRHLERLLVSTADPRVVKRAQEMLTRQPLSYSQVALVIDYTGIGRPVYYLFVDAWLAPIGMTLTNGDAVHSDGWSFRVPKRDLVAATQAVLQSGRLKIAAGLREAQTLRAELIAFKAKVSLSGQDSDEAWRERDHDDLVPATALVCWYREWYNTHLVRGVRSAIFNFQKCHQSRRRGPQSAISVSCRVVYADSF